MPTFNAHFLAWIYGSEEDVSRDHVLERFQRLMRHVGHDRLRAWWPYALVGEEQRSEFAALWRRRVLNRSLDGGRYATLLNLFYSLAWIADFQDCLQLAQVKVKSPVLWIMKGLQRLLCEDPSDDWNGEVVWTGLGGLLYVKSLYLSVPPLTAISYREWGLAFGLDPIAMVQSELGVPLLPYMGKLAIAATVREPDEVKFGEHEA